MKKIGVCICLVLCTVLLGAGQSYPYTVYVDEVVLFDQPSGSSSAGGPATDALGAPDGNHVSIDIPETLILAFTDNIAVNGAGNDIKIYQVVAGDSDVAVYAGNILDNLTYIATIDDNYEFDLDSFSLDFVRYIKFVGLDNGGTSPGFDLDAVEALNSAPVPIPGALYLLGPGLLGLIGLKRRLGL